MIEQALFVSPESPAMRRCAPVFFPGFLTPDNLSE
jgi:hypothetical protein